METEIELAKKIMGKNFIGVEEILKQKTFFDLKIPEKTPKIPFSEEELKEKSESHILILFVNEFSDCKKVSLCTIRQSIEENTCPNKPVFYNQDWYFKESFYKRTENECFWALVRKNILDNSRGKNPKDLVSDIAKFPSALLLTYTFFLNYVLNNGERLWNNDYVWCSDTDDVGDQIYVGKYTDPLALAADGFEIHRHLSIKNNYGVI